MTVPADLFSGGVQGFWIDVQDLTTLFSDTGRGTLANLGDQVKSISDKSGNNNHLSLTSTNGPVLSQDGGTGKYYLAFTGAEHLTTTGSFACTNASTGQWSAGFAIRPNATTLQRVLDGNTGATATFVGSLLILSGGAFRTQTGLSNNTATASDNTTATMTSGTDTYAVGVTTATTVEAFLAGVSDGSTALATTPAVRTNGIRLGANFNGGGNGLNSRFYGGVWVANSINSTDRGSLETYLSGLYAGAGGATYTLTAASGSLALSGTAVTLKAARLLSAASASYALNGTAASLKAARKITAASASYALNGTAVALKAARKLTASSGTFTLTGTAVTLSYTPSGAYTMVVLPGSFTLGGSGVTFTVPTPGLAALDARLRRTGGSYKEWRRVKYYGRGRA